MAIEILIREADYGRCISFLICERDNQGNTTHIVKPIDKPFLLEPVKPEEPIKPTFDLGDRQSVKKSLMQELLNLDVKPEPVSKLEGLLEATKYHLEDLRTLLRVRQGKKAKTS